MHGQCFHSFSCKADAFLVVLLIGPLKIIIYSILAHPPLEASSGWVTRSIRTRIHESKTQTKDTEFSCHVASILKPWICSSPKCTWKTLYWDFICIFWYSEDIWHSSGKPGGNLRGKPRYIWGKSKRQGRGCSPLLLLFSCWSGFLLQCLKVLQKAV